MELLQAELQRQSQHRGVNVVLDLRNGRDWKYDRFRLHQRVRVSVRLLQGPNRTVHSASGRGQ